ncbi:cytochrome c [Limnobacter sp.]|uniref:c-type cytochrome n=1 Tax=Limnobacter sp. TaxID=2003368 RepID=UPI002E330606|nr:cytochrome c [Limnobacter sp.]
MTLLYAAAVGLGCILTAKQACADTDANKYWNGDTQYHVHCSSCHGNWGQGIGLFGPPLKGDAFVVHGSVDIIAQTIEQGRQGAFKHYRAYSGMPVFNQLPVGEIDAIVDYLKNGLQEATPPDATPAPSSTGQ